MADILLLKNTNIRIILANCISRFYNLAGMIHPAVWFFLAGQCSATTEDVQKILI